jgi:hypothetical protein
LGDTIAISIRPPWCNAAQWCQKEGEVSDKNALKYHQVSKRLRRPILQSRSRLESKLADTGGAQFIVVAPRHEAFVLTRVHDEDDPASDLRAQEVRLVIPDFLPFGEVFANFGVSGTRWCLTVRGVYVLHTRAMVHAWHAL